MSGERARRAGWRGARPARRVVRRPARRVVRRPGRAIAVLAVALVLGLVASACDSASAPSAATDAPSANPNAGIVRIAASSALQPALNAIQGAYEASNPGTHLVFHFGAPQPMASAVQVGGFDLLVVDDLPAAQAVVSARRAGGPAQVFGTMPVALVVPAADPAGIHAPEDLAKPGVRIAAGPENAALTATAADAVGHVAALPGHAADFAQKVAANTTYGPDDAAGLLAKVEAGQVDAAFVYEPQAKASSKVTIVPLPSGAAIRNRFAVVEVADAQDPAAAAAFMRWLTTKDGQAALAMYGLQPPASS